MHILHLCYTFPPDPPGGTEIYVDALCRGLSALGLDVTVAAPAAEEAGYDLECVRVRRFASRTPGLDELYAGDPDAAAQFGRLLDEEAPDVVHQHALTSACSPLLAIEAKRRGIPVVFTYHTPTVSCQRGTLLEHGSTPCDGRLEVRRCAACTLEGLGAGSWMSGMLAGLPPAGGDLIGRMGRHGGAWTALRMSSLLRRRHAAFRLLVAEVDRFVVLSPWVERLLRLNQIPDDKMVCAPHGVAWTLRRTDRGRRKDGPLRLMHLGRLDPTKGTELLVRAFGAVPDAHAGLDVFGIAQNGQAHALQQRLHDLAGADPRVRVLPPLRPAEVVERMAEYDMVVVPSQWMETGPLVVLEAFAAGVPVLGSDLGGVGEKVTDGVDGLLVRPFASAAAWSAAIARCAADRGLVEHLARGVRTPRPATAVAEQMDELYRDVTGTRRESHASVRSTPR